MLVCSFITSLSKNKQEKNPYMMSLFYFYFCFMISATWNKYLSWNNSMREKLKKMTMHFQMTCFRNPSYSLLFHMNNSWILLLDQITPSSSVLSFKGSPYWMAPEVPNLAFSLCMFFFFSLFMYNQVYYPFLISNCFYSGYNEPQWVQPGSGYMEPWMHNSWDGNIKAALEPIWGGGKPTFMQHTCFLFHPLVPTIYLCSHSSWRLVWSWRKRYR